MSEKSDRKPEKTLQKTQLAVIGGGPGGYAAAFQAADLGLDVTLIDPEAQPGGVCLYRGCIPSKALLHIAKVISEAEEAAAIGLGFAAPRLDLDRMRQWRDEVIGQLTGGLGQTVTRKKVHHLRGMARFENATTLSVAGAGGQAQALTFEHAIVATGSEPVLLPGLDGTTERILDSTGALALHDVPKSLLIVGGGYIGLELGTVYAALGSEVTVVEMMPTILPGVDRDLVSVLKRRLDRKFATIMLQAKVTELKEQKNGVSVKIVDGKGQETSRRFEKVLIAVGRRPCGRDLGLQNTRAELDEKGFVKVDAERRTAEPTIFAIGDVAGEPMLAHKASSEGKIAAEVIAGHKAVFAPRAIPAVVFTDPEIAWCGLTETEARAEKRTVRTAKIPWRSNGRTLTLGRDDGITKVIVDPETERVLGIGMAGPGAGELIAEGVVAMEMAAVAEDLRLSIHPHPTLSETLMEAAEAVSSVPPRSHA